MTGFVLRAPWYVRERAEIGLSDPAALRPALQMYDNTDFAERIVKDPCDSLAFSDADDRWTYPIPVTPSATAVGRKRLATWDFITTDLRKLYQPNHNRFYTVVTEVFCDQPGLPRAGSHTDLEVGFVMRRQLTTLTGEPRPTRRMARNLVVELARENRLHLDGDGEAGDVRDLWWADRSWRRRVAQDNRDLIGELSVTTQTQGWFVAKDGSRGWKPVDTAGPDEHEEELPMWRLPPREQDCDAAHSRSTWFGLVPTYSAEHSIAPAGGTTRSRAQPKYDDHAIYELHCFVRRRPARGHEHCPAEIWWNQAPSEPFRLASPMDPQGTSKRLTSITLPDLRRLAARAGRPMGPGGVAITTPPQSRLVFNPFGGIPASGSGAIGAAGGICTFALELFFIVAFFLFLMFLPIVVFAFQLWWMLALRFCIPPSVGFDLTVDFLADLDVDVDIDAAFHADAGFGAYASALDALTPTAPGPTPDQAFDQIFGTDSTELPTAGVWLTEMAKNTDFNTDLSLAHAAALSTDPDDAVPPTPPALEDVPADPLCG